MGNLKFIIFSCLLCSTVYARHDYPDFICGNNHFDIRFPFALQGQNLQNSGYPGFTLRCSNQGRAILSLPGAGDFYVRDIDYLTQEIQLYDPSNCLPKRLFNFSTSSSPSSPFKAVSHRKFTFLTCSTNSVSSLFNVIGCLSNSTTSTLATSSTSLASQMTSLYNCSIMNTSSVPVSWTSQYESDFSTDLNNDLVLAWDEPNCQECEAKQGVCGFRNATSGEIQCFDSGTGSNRGLQIFKFIALTLLIPAITCAIGVSCYICLDYNRYSRAMAAVRNTAAAIQNATNRTTVAPQPAATAGLDDSTIESYTKVVLGESRRVPGPNHMTCPICLAEYNPKETVKSIPECEHCFHAECIDEWLKINGTCPVCRNNPSPAHGYQAE
ncbi:PREDICTED: putative RING-H2 finger protein ATL21A [Nicotiana attenuata]|uniref:putative RING-H2 finger protein ATL21A n=1 Tax=Nicotiana attenuata TaxID=49451 RepID=UPI0009055CCD|nr:PREDICTED: putative RING-H2 finger protein ATL21A [Nicotiana attenuata]